MHGKGYQYENGSTCGDHHNDKDEQRIRKLTMLQVLDGHMWPDERPHHQAQNQRPESEDDLHLREEVEDTRMPRKTVGELLNACYGECMNERKGKDDGGRNLNGMGH